MLYSLTEKAGAQTPAGVKTTNSLRHGFRFDVLIVALPTFKSQASFHNSMRLDFSVIP